MPWRPAEPEDGENAVDLSCEIWTGYTDGEGRPVVRTKDSGTTAARARWERENGPIAEGLKLANLCGEILCVNPRHWTPLTQKQILYRAGVAKLSPTQAERVKTLARTGMMSGRRIADIMNVDEGTIRAVLKGTHWTQRET